MKNFGKIISDKDIITKEYLDSKGYISAITSKMVTDALGFTPFDSAAFTKNGIKNALGIADWALAANKPSYDDVYLKLAGGTINGNLTIAANLTVTGNITTAGELSAKNYMIGQYLPSAPLNSFATAIFGKSDSDACKMRLQLCTVTIEGVGVQYSPLLAVKTFSTHGFISFGYNSTNKDKCYIGAGNGDAVNWSGILFHNNMSLIPKTDNTFDIGDSSYRWKGVYANNLYASSLYGHKPSGASYHQFRILYSGGRLYLQAGSDDGTATSGIVTVSGINAASLNEFQVFATKSYYTGNVEVNGTAAFAQTIYATGNITTAGELSAKNYMIGQYLPSAPLNSFATAIFGKSDSDACKMRLQLCTVTIEGVGVQYSPLLAVKTFSTHGFISFGYNSANKDKCYIGAGNGDAVNWSGILFHNNMSLIPKTDNTYTLGDSSYRWKEVYANNVTFESAAGHNVKFDGYALNVNAGLYIGNGYSLRLNGQSITKWSDLGTYITPISSETTSEKTISPNTFYKWGSVSALSITLGAATNNTHINNYMFEFTASTGFALGGLSGVKWADGVKPNIKAGYTYQFSIINNCATYSAFKTA